MIAAYIINVAAVASYNALGFERGVLRSGAIAPWKLTCLAYIVALVALLLVIHAEPSLYNEGLTLTSAMRVGSGEIPYRDFWTHDSPGQFYVSGMLFKVFGASMEVQRIWDMVVRAFVPMLAYLLVSSISGRRAGAVAWFLLLLCTGALAGFAQGTLLAYSLYLLAAYLVIEGPTRRRALVGGLLVGLGSWFSLRGGLSCLLCVLVVLAVRAPERRADREVHPGVFLAGYLAGLAPAALYFGTKAGFGTLVYNLVVFQATVSPRFRHLGYPPLASWDGAFFFCPFAVYAASSIWLIWRGRRQPGSRAFQVVLFLTLLGLLGFDQARIRSDIFNALLFEMPALMLLSIFGVPALREQRALLARSVWTLAAAAFGAILWGALSPRLLTIVRAWQDLSDDASLPRASNIKLPVEVAAVTEFIAGATLTKEPIFVANTRQDVAYMNDALLYFLADRPCATRWHDLYPGVVTTLPVQQAIVRDLRAKHVRIVVLDSRYEAVREPNEGSVSSHVTLLDRYLQSNYARVFRAGQFTCLLRNEEAGPRAPTKRSSQAALRL